MERQAPIRMTEFAGYVRQFDFGKDAFGWLEVKKSEEGGAKREEGLVIRLGESVTADGRIDMCPGGTIRACAVTCSVEKTGWVRIPLTADRRNTCGMNEETSKQVVKLPEATGVIMPFRYAEVEGGGKSGEVDVRRVWLHWPIDEGASSFSSSSPALDRVYDFCKYSIVATSFAGVYVDGDRERIPYEADGYINQLCHYAIDCDFAMARATYRRLLKFPTWPTEWKQHMIMMAWTDWMWSGSIELAKESYDTLKNEKLLLDIAREDGLVVSGGTRYPKMFNGNDIVDWPPGERDGFEVRPVNAVVNAFHYLNLVQMSEIAQALGKSEDARFFRERAAKVKTAFNRVFTDGKTQLYIDGEGAQHSSAHANIAALAFGLVPEERVGAVADFIERKGMVCSVYFAQYLLEALFKADRAEAAIRLMTAVGDRSWLGMMESGSTITMEAWSLAAKPNQDWNHAWATAPLNIIARYVLGVTPVEPGFTKVRVRPQPGGLKRVCGTVPIPGGAVKVTIDDGKLTVDSSSKAVIEWKEDEKMKLTVIDPGHFHAALVQKRSYPEIASDVKVFAPDGKELDSYLKMVNQFNRREGDPTEWNERVFRGRDYLSAFAADGATGKRIVVLAGRNDRKGEYALKAVEAGCNVLSDKPMAITPEQFAVTERAARLAESNGLMFADIMTERNEITTILQRELTMDRELYGTQENGTQDDPAVVMQSVHHFCKLVNGRPLERPEWYYDTAIQGEGIADVTTHLVDLVQWETFPGVRLEPSDVKVLSARVWPTMITPEQFKMSTGGTRDAAFDCMANGEFTWSLRGVNCKVSVEWNFMAPKGAGDTHYSLMRGTKAEVFIRQGERESYKPVLYVRSRIVPEETRTALAAAIKRIAGKWPGVCVEPTDEEGLWRIGYPAKYDVGHEAHFGQVVRMFIDWLKVGKEDTIYIDNMLVKYRTIVEAWKLAHGQIVFDIPDSQVEFGGVGFQNAEANLVSLMTDEFRDERVLKSFREISPTFARVYAGFADCPKSQMDRFADYYDQTFRHAGTELYVVAGVMPFVPDAAAEEYAEKVAKNLEYLVRGRGLSGIRHYCLTNELGIDGRGGWFYNRMDSFRRFFVALHSAFRRHGLDIALVATDVNAHMKDSLRQLDWAVKNMDDLVGGYCTHWYMFLGNGLVPSSPQNAITMADHFAPLVAKAAEKGKRYFVGEIGVWTPPVSGCKVMHDDTGYPLRAPQFANEGAITLAEIALAAINAGAYGALSWSFADHPDPFVIEDGDTSLERAVYESARCAYWPDWKYNKWGVFRWDSADCDYSAYPSLYTMGYMAKLFRRGSRVLKRTVNDRDVRAGGVVNRDGSLSLAVINWGAERDLEILMPDELARKPMRIYEYDSANPPLNDFNDLQCPKGVASVSRGRLRLRFSAKSMTFLTTDYQESEPAKVDGVKIVDGMLVWNAVTDTNHCYYRVYRNGRQIASTVATHCGKQVASTDEIKVFSVDRWGNQGR